MSAAVVGVKGIPNISALFIVMFPAMNNSRGSLKQLKQPLQEFQDVKLSGKFEANIVKLSERLYAC